MLRQTIAACLSLVVLLVFTTLQAIAIDPVREGDQVEMEWLGGWIPAEVVAFNKTKGIVQVKYEFAGSEKVGEFPLAKIRFPNDEGAWMVWSDESGKFKIEARMIRLTETNVILRKEDGKEIAVPIDKLSTRLQSQIKKIHRTVEKIKDKALVKVGDEIEVQKWRTWYPAKVIGLLPQGGAMATYQDGKKELTEEFDYENMRYANGEGPWADWLDATGKHKIKARYITHDETHVTLLREDGKKSKVAYEKLASSIRKQLATKPIITPRPEEVLFDLSKADFKNLESWMSYGTKLPQVEQVSLQLDAAPQTLQLEPTSFEFEINPKNKISLVEPIGGTESWMIIGSSESSSEPKELCELLWVNLKSGQTVRGPNFSPDERILGYSAKQSRLITAEVRGTWQTVIRYCSYRITPGQSKAVPEAKWSVPEIAFGASSGNGKVRFVGSDRVFLPYGGTASLWNLKERRAEYVVPLHGDTVYLSPDERYFITNQFSHAVIHDTQDGKPVAQTPQGKSSFSVDGKYLLGAGHMGYSLVSLSKANYGETVTLRGQSMTQDSSPTLIDDEWLCNGESLFSKKLGLHSWTYQMSDRKPIYHQMFGEHLLSVAKLANEPRENADKVQVQIVALPHRFAKEAISRASVKDLYILNPGDSVRIDASVTNPQMLAGIRRAIQKNQWREDPSSESVILASAGPGTHETRTYSYSRFGFARGNDSSEQTVSATPWIQTFSIKHRGAVAWETRQGGIPFTVVLREGDSLQNEIRKCEQPSFELFEHLAIPTSLVAPKYRNGFGKSEITANGFVDQVVR